MGIIFSRCNKLFLLSSLVQAIIFKSIFGTLDSNYDKTNEITQLDAICLLHSDATSVNELDAARLVKIRNTCVLLYVGFECNKKKAKVFDAVYELKHLYLSY